MWVISGTLDSVCAESKPLRSCWREPTRKCIIILVAWEVSSHEVGIVLFSLFTYQLSFTPNKCCSRCAHWLMQTKTSGEPLIKDFMATTEDALVVRTCLKPLAPINIRYYHPPIRIRAGSVVMGVEHVTFFGPEKVNSEVVWRMPWHVGRPWRKQAVHPFSRPRPRLVTRYFRNLPLGALPSAVLPATLCLQTSQRHFCDHGLCTDFALIIITRSYFQSLFVLPVTSWGLGKNAQFDRVTFGIFLTFFTESWPSYFLRHPSEIYEAKWKK